MDAERLTVALLLHRHASTTPDLQFVVTEDDALTYAEAERASARLAARLVRAGVGKGTRVGLLRPNGCEWALTAIAVMRIGAVLVPLSTLLRPPELAAQLRAAGVEHLICVTRTRSHEHLEDLATISPSLQPDGGPSHVAEVPRLRSILVWDDTSLDRELGPDPGPEPEAALVASYEALVHPADDMVVIFSSGSRGAPKAVVHTHGGALGATQSGLAARCIHAGERLYIPMPFFWMGGFGGGLITVFVAGATLITEAEPAPERTLRLLERERVTLFRGWPDQATALASHPEFANADLSTLKAGSLDGVLPVEMRGRPGIRPILFGMTETFGPYCADPLDRDLPPEKYGSLGRPFTGVEVAIVDQDTRAPVPRGEVGEIYLRGPNLMRGICGRTRAETFTPDGFYPTGDSGRLDADGYLYFTGRLDDMFKVHGANVYPSEVETALEEIAYVRRAFVVDIGSADTRRVGAAVVLDNDAHAPADLDADARRTLSSFKVPALWAIIGADDVPRAATGKVDKDGLRRLIESA
ncbi:MAG TPA: class I adenylate-forming enzyme family protein [Acidimicrobiales bacterium]|nr:class I adenylate-forming enzyme family protein [Acidimicrobiales bacterium]